MNQNDQYKPCPKCDGWLVLAYGEWKHRWWQRPQWGEGCRYMEAA